MSQAPFHDTIEGVILEEQKTSTQDSSTPAPTPSKPATENEKQVNPPTSENKSNPQ